MAIAFNKGDRHLFDSLIAGGANFNCEHGFIILMENCKQKEMGDLEFLLRNGAPVNRIGYNSMTPLMIASQNGFTEKVKLISNLSTVDINRRNNLGRCSLHLACMNNFLY